MGTRSALVVSLVVALGLVAMACGGESNKPDGGDGGLTACVDDSDCVAPDTCMDDGYCRWDPNPDPDDNTLGGAFSCEMNRGYGMGEISGKFDGRYVYIQYPGAMAAFDPDEDPMAILVLDGLVTDDLVLRLRIKVPDDSPIDTPIKFGAEGVASGTFLHLELDEDGYPINDTPVAEIVGGQIAFGSFGNATSNEVNGTLRAELKKVTPPGE